MDGTHKFSSDYDQFLKDREEYSVRVMTQFLAPKRYVASVDCIDLDELYRSGKRALLVDRDNTLVPRDAAALLPRLAIGLTGRADWVFASVCVQQLVPQPGRGICSRAWYRPRYLVRYEARSLCFVGGAA